jgi:putative SOS response-associated peptidase YedK
MPGRVIHDAQTPDALFSPFGVEIDAATRQGWKPRYNVGPGQGVDVVCMRDGRAVMQHMRWGIPSRQPGIGGSHKFCRSETAREKSPFKEAIAAHRCIVPITGWYEWPQPKEAHCVRPATSQPLGLAGIYQVGAQTTFVILTCEPNGFVKPLHHRMGVFLDPKDYAAWMDPATDADVVDRMLKQVPDDWFIEFRVTNRAARMRNDDPKCVAPISPAALKRAAKPKRYGGRLGNLR